MDAVFRGRRLLLIAALLGAAIAACGAGSKDGRPPVGTSDHAPGRGSSGGIGAGSDAGSHSGAAALPAGYRSSFTKLNRERMLSTGHASGRWEVDVFANEAAAKALAARAKDVPVGAIVVEEHYERVEGRPAGPVMVMEKREKGFAPEHGDWRWVVIASSGALVKDGFVDSCAGCHDASPMDGLFPIAAP